MPKNRIAFDFSPGDSPHLLITRLSHIGDCVLTLPMLEALKRNWPNSRIYWAMESPGPKLLAHHPAIDEILPIPRDYLKSPREIWKLRTRLRAARIDLAVDPQSLTKSSVLGWLSGARFRVGFGGRYGKELSTWLNNHLVLPDSTATHLVDRSLQLVDSLTDCQDQVRRSLVRQPGTASLNLPLTVEATQWMAEQQSAGAIPQTYIVLNPGASWPSKRWENDRWAEVASQLAQDGLSVVVTWAGPEEKAWAEEIVARSGAGVVLAPSTSLLQLAALCQSSLFFLGCDTGPMHIAAAVGKRCVVLFGPTLPEESGPYGHGHVCLQAWHQTEQSGKKKLAENRAMRDIRVDQVVAACRGVMQIHGRKCIESDRRSGQRQTGQGLHVTNESGIGESDRRSGQRQTGQGLYVENESGIGESDRRSGQRHAG
ncbi:MAG: glycosyltransferase family 9 protein [Planctomycetaceae bacterium]|nr:glycosyltransferase family 9 protein [Planctomycetaceae bacterium]